MPGERSQRKPLRSVAAGWACLCGAWSLAASATLAAAEPQSFDALAQEYERQTRPLAKQFCLDCHATAQPEGELDLERFASLADVRRSPTTWVKVAEMLDNGEMPPKDSPQPTAEQRKQLRSWVERYLNAEAHAQAGDPGPVVLRRLSNAEYTYTVRDLTGAPLHPAREFPVDGASGEGFTNTGNALVMSPALLTKYFDAGKDIASHVVLLPDGFRFSAAATRSDWTNEILAQIRAFYREFSDAQGATRVNLQGIVFDTNDGGRLPVERYLSATLVERDALQSGRKTLATVAREHQLNPRYLTSLWEQLHSTEPSLLLDALRTSWRAAQPSEAAALAADVARWQQALTRFQSVGHMKSWMTPVNPLVSQQEVRFKIAPPESGDEVRLYLAAGSAGDGAAHDVVVWRQPRLVTPGRADLPLRDLRSFARQLAERRTRLFASTAAALNAAAAASRAGGQFDVEELARRHGAPADALTAWLDYLGIGPQAAVKLNHFTDRISSASNYDFVTGWGSHQTPLVLANSSDAHVRIPGNMKPHGVVVHPSPTLSAAVGWRSPIAGEIALSGVVAHAHPECGNGVTWSVELRRGNTRQRLATGVAAGQKKAPIGPIEKLAVQPGDLVSLLIGPRDGNHSCDLTDLEFVLKTTGEPEREWNLTRDVSGDIGAGNPHADRFGNAAVWHFYSEPVQANELGPVIPAGSVLARWQAAPSDADQQALARQVQQLLTDGPPADANHPDAVLYRQLASLGGPLFAGARGGQNFVADAAAGGDGPGLDPALFGRHPDGSAVDALSLCVAAPSVIEVRLPADLVVGSEFVTTAVLHPQSAADGSVQVQVAASRPEAPAALRAGLPILVGEQSPARQRFEKSFDDFRRWFPAALCYTRIVPVDEVVTLTLFHREDEPLMRLMLDDDQRARLDRLWDELHFVSHDALTLVDAFAQLMEYATQDGDPKLFEPYRKPIHDRAAAFRQELVAAESKQVAAAIAFAQRAFRRPLTDAEAQELRRLYAALRADELPHDDALRLLLAKIFVSPAFLYRLEQPAAGEAAAPVSDYELASRLSYFLWSSLPDEPLLETAAAGRLRSADELTAQTQRMLRDERVRRLAIEFACQWLHIRDFDAFDEKSERHFPTFAALRGDMYEESIRFFVDLFQRDGSVLSILDADHTFVNAALAEHYGIPGVSGPEWRRVDGLKQLGRGGILGLSATLAKQSGASRTSPILRGNWVAEVLLGDKLPKPPPGVPQLPEDETATAGLTVRQLVEKHSSDAKCSGCHARIDPFGYTLEGFDAIGRLRQKDLADRPIDARVKLPDGTELNGLDGLRTYLLTTRRDAVLRQFCRKLLGYALGRGVQLSDEPLLAEMQRNLAENGFRFSVAATTIVRSRQFREIRGAADPRSAD